MLLVEVPDAESRARDGRKDLGIVQLQINSCEVENIANVWVGIVIRNIM